MHIMSVIIAVVIIKHQVHHISTAGNSDFCQKATEKLQPTKLIIAPKVFIGI